MSRSNGNMLVYAAIIIAVIALGYGLIFSGPEGPEGPPGPAGPQGLQGPQGEPGEGIDETELATQIEDQISERLAFNITASKEPLRGCPSCHVLVDPNSGRYTLSYEAHERTEARRGEDTHPNIAPDGTDITVTSEAGLETCLLCHASDPETERGLIAPLSLRDIVHPAHMISQVFKIYYGGNCFTCHNVNADGEFEVLGYVLEVNEKGVPNPDIINPISFGGKLYDKWWTASEEAEDPVGDFAVWALQTTNTRTGSDTWRCKECHGWDYKGADGAYSSGSHYTGFPGLYNTRTKTTAQILAALSGDVVPIHDFSTVLNEDELKALVDFIKNGGVIDVSLYINDDKSLIDGDSANGEILYENTCIFCHGVDGTALPEALGELANDNPWEVMHKIRFGQPGVGMPAAVDNNWSTNEVVDLLKYLQTLPSE